MRRDERDVEPRRPACNWCTENGPRTIRHGQSKTAVVDPPWCGLDRARAERPGASQPDDRSLPRFDRRTTPSGARFRRIGTLRRRGAPVVSSARDRIRRRSAQPIQRTPSAGCQLSTRCRVREVANRDRIERFLNALAREATTDTQVFLVGGTSAVLIGWREATVDVDLVMRPESDALLRAIPMLKERLNINVELASPDQFIPVPPDWEERSPLVSRIGRLTIRHYDFVAQALSKIERGHTRDLADVQAMVARGLITPALVRDQFARIESELYRFPAIDPPSFRKAIDDAFPPPS